MSDVPESSPAAAETRLFQWIIPPAVLFVITALAVTMTAFGNQQAPATQWLIRNGPWLLGLEAAATVGLCLAAMWTDQHRTPRQPTDAP